MVFQFQRSERVNLDEPLENQSLFGVSPIIEEWQRKLDTVFSQLINKETKFGVEDVDAAIKKHINSVLFVAPPNVVILEPGEAPSKNEHVHRAVDMFMEDFGYTENGMLNLVCDEAIYRRMKDYKNDDQTANCILGQWHTNKAMCSALIAAFSGYGLFGLAAQLGVKFLDKLEQIADYRATFRVLELIWIAVGVAIHLYAEEKDIFIKDILTIDNDLLKVWYNFYQWAGYLKLHKLGIRMANFDLQMYSLMAFAPLFPITRKYRYAESTARFLSDLQNKPQFLQDLRTIPSINLTREGHYFAFDEALETFGVKFVKQNMTGRATNVENLKQNIESVQAEYERLDLLISEFAEDRITNKSSRSVKDRKEALWDLIFKLKLRFCEQHSETCTLFTETTQLTGDGYKRMFTCYQLGIETMVNNLTTGGKKWRSKSELLPMKVKNIKKRGREVETRVEEMCNSSVQVPESHNIEETDDEGIQSIPLFETESEAQTPSRIRRKKHKPTDDEEQILKQLELYKDSTVLPKEFIDQLAMDLLKYTDHWTPLRIRFRWYNQYKRSKVCVK
jgi:hypothetical protein